MGALNIPQELLKDLVAAETADEGGQNDLIFPHERIQGKLLYGNGIDVDRGKIRGLGQYFQVFHWKIRHKILKCIHMFPLP